MTPGQCSVGEIYANERDLVVYESKKFLADKGTWYYKFQQQISIQRKRRQFLQRTILQRIENNSQPKNGLGNTSFSSKFLFEAVKMVIRYPNERDLVVYKTGLYSTNRKIPGRQRDLVLQVSAANSYSAKTAPISNVLKDLNGVRSVRSGLYLLSSHVRTLLRKYCTVLFY